jgi:hypothetical protein
MHALALRSRWLASIGRDMQRGSTQARTDSSDRRIERVTDARSMPRDLA